MAQQTAVEWLWRWIMDNPFSSFDDGVKAYTQAKAMEKEQIINAHIDGQSLVSCKDEYAEQYYNQTYKHD